MSIFAGLKLVTGPVVEPVTLDDVKLHCRLDSAYTAEDAYLTRLMSMGRQWAENHLRRAFLPQTWRLSLKNWPGRNYGSWPADISTFDSYYKLNHIKLPRPPLISVASVIYRDTTNALLTMPPGNISGGYNVDTESEPGMIVLPFSGVWPTEILLPGSPIRIAFTCGYSDVDTFTDTFEGSYAAMQAILLLVAHWYDVRQPIADFSVAKVGMNQLQNIIDLLDPHVMHEGVS